MHAQGRRKAVDDDVDLDDEEYFDDAQASPYSACMVQLTFAVELTPHETMNLPHFTSIHTKE